MTGVTAEMIGKGRRGDPDEAARRRKMNIKLKHARQSLTSSTGDAAGPYDSMVRLYAESARSSALATALLLLGVGYAALFWVPLPLELGWLIASLVLLGWKFLVGA